MMDYIFLHLIVNYVYITQTQLTFFFFLLFVRFKDYTNRSTALLQRVKNIFRLRKLSLTIAERLKKKISYYDRLAFAIQRSIEI